MDKLEKKMLEAGFEKTLTKDISQKDTKPGAFSEDPGPSVPKIDYKPAPFVAAPLIGGWDEEAAQSGEADPSQQMDPETQYAKLDPQAEKPAGKEPASIKAAQPGSENSSDEEACLKELKNEDMGEFMKYQGELTASRLAWTYLDNTKMDGKYAEKIEKTIDGLLVKMSADEHKKAAELFAKTKLSREALDYVMPHLVQVLEDKKDPKKKDYQLSDADVKTIGLLAEYEKAQKSSSRLSSDTSKNESMMNMLKLVNSSYFYGENGKTSVLTSQAKIDENKSLLEKRMGVLKDKMKVLVGKGVVSASCTPPNDPADDPLCVPPSVSEIDLVSQTDKILKKMSDDKSSPVNQQIENHLKYNKFWLRVKN
jgi:hypothetical protein